MKTLTVGDQAPDFELPDQDGTPTRLSTLLLDGPVVLFFYPAAMTGGCTQESCHFPDLAAQFADAHGFDYPLLSDPDGTVAAGFGVKRKLVSYVKRATFVIDTDRTIREVVSSETNFTTHADTALESLKALQRR